VAPAAAASHHAADNNDRLSTSWREVISLAGSLTAMVSLCTLSSISEASRRSVPAAASSSLRDQSFRHCVWPCHEQRLARSAVELVYLRVSQINNCAYWLDLHTCDLTKKDVPI
jgi:AhpD family alkylhydroperoxidase